MHRLIIFFGLLGDYLRIRLWADRLCHTDLMRLAIPIVTDNRRNDFIMGKHYAPSRSADWVLKEMAVHNLAYNVTITSKHAKWDSGKRSVLAGGQKKCTPSDRMGGRPIGRCKFLVY